MRGIVHVCLLFCFLAGGSLLRAADGAQQITREQAESLVKKWLTGAGYPTRSQRFILDADPDRADFPTFYFFSASYVQEQSAPTLGHFAINRRTAELWDWELCKKLSTPSLRVSQSSLRKKIGLTDEVFHELSKSAPCSGPS